MEQERIEGSRQTVKTLFYGPLVLAVVFAYFGHWVLAIVSLALWLLVGVVVGSALVRRTGLGGGMERSLFDFCLELRRPASKDLHLFFKILYFVLWPSITFISLLLGDYKFLNRGLGTGGERWLLERLESDEEYDRWRAARMLARVGSPDSLPGLASALSDKSSGVRRAAVSAISNIGSIEAIDALQQFAESADDDTDYLQTVAELCSAGLSVTVDAARVVRAVNLFKTKSEYDEETLGELLGKIPLAVSAPYLKEYISDGARPDSCDHGGGGIRPGGHTRGPARNGFLRRHVGSRHFAWGGGRLHLGGR